VCPHLVDLLGWEQYTSSPDLVHDDAHPQVPVLGLPGAAPS
jgi:lipoyl(octanoyl) transferase